MNFKTERSQILELCFDAPATVGDVLVACVYCHLCDRCNVTCYSYHYKKLSCRREAARCFVTLNISLSH